MRHAPLGPTSLSERVPVYEVSVCFGRALCLLEGPVCGPYVLVVSVLGYSLSVRSLCVLRIPMRGVVPTSEVSMCDGKMHSGGFLSMLGPWACWLHPMCAGPPWERETELFYFAVVLQGSLSLPS